MNGKSPPPKKKLKKKQRKINAVDPNCKKRGEGENREKKN